MDNRKYFLDVTKVFFLAFIALNVFLTTLFFFLFRHDFISSLKIAAIFSTLVSFFMSVHVARDLKVELLEITSGNKDKMKPMSWYENEILAQLSGQRYREQPPQEGFRVFEPRLLSQTMGGNVYLKSSAFEITLRGPRGFIRIVASILDIKKIYL